MIWLIAIYIMCGLGVSLALDDGRLKGVTLLAAFVVGVIFWPVFFMFAVVLAIQCFVHGASTRKKVSF